MSRKSTSISDRSHPTLIYSLPSYPIPSKYPKPIAYITNLWCSIQILMPISFDDVSIIRSNEFSVNDMYTFARKLARSEYAPKIDGEKTSLIVTLRKPSCTAVLNRSGKLLLMGTITEQEGRRHAYKIAKYLKTRTKWEWVNKIHRGEDGKDIEYQGWDYCERKDITMDQESFKIDQRVITLDLKGYKPPLKQISKHPNILGRFVDMKGNIYIRLPKEIFEDFEEFSDSIVNNQTPNFSDPNRGITSGPSVCIYGSGKVLIWGCANNEEIDAAIFYIFPPLYDD